ncbi:hypothetical protein B0H10DRAFT_1938673 [Mycena sp. CBHHK59/15]|nr:hypothetical protein B0H10DRAFT_1938673 [Mycena sp. CBHHK59/15]
MGWFDDNHPMGSRAQDDEDAVVAAMGWNRWHKDPQPSGGASEPKRVERPGDETKWRKTNLKDGDTMAKGKAKTMYLLTDKDLLPLQYQKQMNSAGYNNMKMYRKREVERLSWKKYGGPNGLKAAKADKKSGIKPAATKSSPSKTKSSTTAATGAEAETLGKGKGRAKNSNHDEESED